MKRLSREQIEALKNRANLITLVSETASLAPIKGGGWVADRCPLCGYEGPVFFISRDGRRFLCRRCLKKGDIIDYLWESKQAESFSGVLGILAEQAGEPLPEGEAGELESFGYVLPYAAPRREKHAHAPLEFEPRKVAYPCPTWQEHAEKFIDGCASALQENTTMLTWLKARGVPAWVARRCRLGWNGKMSFRPAPSWGLLDQVRKDGKPRLLMLPPGLTVPEYAHDGQLARVRILLFNGIQGPDTEPEGTFFIKGSALAPLAWMGPHALRRRVVIVEDPLSAIALAYARGSGVAGAVLADRWGAPDRASHFALKLKYWNTMIMDTDALGPALQELWRRTYHVRFAAPPDGKKHFFEAIRDGLDGVAYLRGLEPISSSMKMDLEQLTEHQRRAFLDFMAEREDDDAFNELLFQLATREPIDFRRVPRSVRELVRVLLKNQNCRLRMDSKHYDVEGRKGCIVPVRLWALKDDAAVIAWLVHHPDEYINYRNVIPVVQPGTLIL